METVKNKVAVVTGGGSGIGEAIAREAAARGMSVVVADIDEVAAERVAGELSASGAQAIAAQVDVSNLASVEALRQTAVDAFSAVHLLCNNAGVWVGAQMAEADIRDWRYLIDVNLYGAIHGVKVFLPDMLASGEGHIVNTASMGGLLSGPPEGLYCTTKFAIVGLSESLLLEVADKGVGVSVLCPGLVNTALIESSARLRPSALQHGRKHDVVAPAVETGMSPQELGRRVIDAVIDGDFYIITHPEYRDILAMRHAGILDALDKQAERYG